MGGQQLMLDFATIKQFLFELPAATSFVSSRFNSRVEKSMGKVEMLLKIIGLTSVNSLVDTYKFLILDGNEAEFERILDIKGFSPEEKNFLLDCYNNRISKPPIKERSKSPLKYKDYLPLDKDLKFQIITSPPHSPTNTRSKAMQTITQEIKKQSEHEAQKPTNKTENYTEISIPVPSRKQMNKKEEMNTRKHENQDEEQEKWI